MNNPAQPSGFGAPQPQAQAQGSQSPNLPSPNNGQAHPQNLADILVAEGLISQGQYEDLKVEAAKNNTNVDNLIAEKGMVEETKLAQAKAKFLHVPYIDLPDIGVSPEALNHVPEAVARRYQLLPFNLDKENNTLSVAMANPLDLKAIDFIEKKTGFRLIPHLITETDLKIALDERYAQSLGSEVSEALKDTSEPKKRTIDVSQLGEVIREAPIAKIVETLLTFAMRARASDIHIEPQEDKTRIRYRIDGVLHEKLVLPLRVHDAVISRIKILARMKIDERRIPQDGRFTFRMGDEEVDLRVSSLPTVHSEKIVMRLLKKGGQVPTLANLGLRGMALKSVENAILVPHGIIVISGPTGSGKTTTLYSILSKINTPRVNIITLEDPVEYEIPGVNQVQVNPQAGLTFASGMRSFLRQDPNIIMVGEVRDKETAELAIQASLTGHLVFSTLHTNSAAGALPRLLDMEAEPFLLASSMTLVMAQRVVRRICEHCRTEYTPEPAVMEDIKKVLGTLYDGWRQQNKNTNPVLYKGTGCVECNDTGYSGLIGIFEVMPVTEKIGKLILERAPASQLEAASVQNGMVLMKQDGYIKSLEGITTIEEIIRVAEV